MIAIEEQAVNAPPSGSRWAQLKDRLIDEVSNGLTLERIALELGKGMIAGHLEYWAKNSDWGREPSRYTGQPSLAESIENALSAYFDELDIERIESKRQTPPRITTSVMTSVFTGFDMARTAPAMVDICVPAGSGKTQAMEEYLNRCRKSEGIDCPVWTIGLSEFGLTVKSILLMIAGKVDPHLHQKDSVNEFELDFRIEERTRGLNGLLIIDEAQHLADAKLDHGIRIVNGLRRYVDKGLFGIALLNNGEVYRRISGGKHAQLLSRIKEWRVEIPGVTENDIDLIAASWGISGRDARAWCIAKAKGPGQLRALVSAFRRAQMQFGEINLTNLTKMKG